ncbi:Cytochrome P450 monooxygenase AKT7 [Fusarium oxysporum f. sp. albedinis]|nr:Cytochrome P450 monooxygenase AKT7 [Fusarium oxysporum f. sp. albedinis]
MHNETRNPTAEARRLKKRELDRKAQRLARERTKSRLAQLESMVDNLRQNHSNAQIATLLDQIGKVTQERDNLLQVLDSLGSTIRRHLRDSTAGEPRSDTKSDTSQHASPAQSTPGERIVPITTPRSTSETSSSTILELSINTPPPDPFTCDGWNCTVSNEPYPTTMAFNSIVPQTGNGFIPIQPLLPDVHTPPEVVDVIIPKALVLCPCSSPTSRGANFHDVKPNIWRAINEVLVKPTKLSAEEIAIEEYNSEDMPVRAILEGWDSIERAGKMTPTWRKLRKADELCFTNCADTERLAAMRICHLLIMYHGDPTLERRATLPRWYWNRCDQSFFFRQPRLTNNRPSQALPHSYCIDFFVW